MPTLYTILTLLTGVNAAFAMSAPNPEASKWTIAIACFSFGWCAAFALVAWGNWLLRRAIDRSGN